jgi:hypothetical protein
VVVGRRSDEESDSTAALKRKYQAMMPDVTLMSYDRLAELVERGDIYAA